MTLTFTDCTNLWRERSYVIEMREAAADGAPLSAYVGDGCKRITSWMGTDLGPVMSAEPFSVRTPTGGQQSMVAIRARIDGRWYFGRGLGSGMYITLRAAKR